VKAGLALVGIVVGGLLWGRAEAGLHLVEVILICAAVAMALVLGIENLIGNRALVAWYLRRLRRRLSRSRVEAAPVARPVYVAPRLARVAYERIEDEIAAAGGWDAWSAATSMQLVDSCPDPGNPGHEIRLLRVVAGPWRGNQVAEVVDASPEDGVHRRRPLVVASDATSALSAVAATFGLTADTYRPQRNA